MKKVLFLTVLAIILPLFLFTFVGCMKNPEMTTDYGPETSIEDIQKSIGNDAPLELERIRAGQYVSIDETQVIDIQAPMTYYQRLDEVTSYSQEEGITKLHFNITTNELLDGKWKQTVQSNVPLFFRTENSLPATPLLSPLSRSKLSAFQSNDGSQGLTLQSLRKMASTSKKKVTFHNFSKDMGVMPIPRSVAAKADCGGLPTQICQSGLRFIRIKFDQVIWENETAGTKTALTFVYSPDIPNYIHSWDNMNPADNELYFTNQIRYCQQRWVEIESGNGKQNVPVLACSEIRDFQFGKDNP